MRLFRLAALTATFLAPLAARAAEIQVFVPPVMGQGGVPEIAKAFTAQTGVKVTVTTHAMGRALSDIEKGPATPDVVFLPMDLMSTLALDKGVAPGSFTPVGRVYIALAVRQGSPVPDISTVEKLAAVLKASQGITYSDPSPARGSAEAKMTDDLLHRPEFAGAKGLHGETDPAGGKPGPNGPALLLSGQGDMTLQLQDELNDPRLAVAGPLPVELHAYLDNAAAVSTRAADPANAAAFIKFATSPAARALWHKGVELY